MKDKDKIHQTLNVSFDKEGRVFHRGVALGTTDDERPVNLDWCCEPGIVFHRLEAGSGQQSVNQSSPGVTNWTQTLQHRKVSLYGKVL